MLSSPSWSHRKEHHTYSRRSYSHRRAYTCSRSPSPTRRHPRCSRRSRSYIQPGMIIEENVEIVQHLYITDVLQDQGQSHTCTAIIIETSHSLTPRHRRRSPRSRSYLRHHYNRRDRGHSPTPTYRRRSARSRSHLYTVIIII